MMRMKMSSKKKKKQIEELKKIVWSLLDKINELEAELAAKKKGV